MALTTDGLTPAEDAYFDRLAEIERLPRCFMHDEPGCPCGDREDALDAHSSQMQDWLDELRSQVIDPTDDEPLQYSPRPIAGIGSGDIDDSIPF